MNLPNDIADALHAEGIHGYTEVWELTNWQRCHYCGQEIVAGDLAFHRQPIYFCVDRKACLSRTEEATKVREAGETALILKLREVFVPKEEV